MAQMKNQMKDPLSDHFYLTIIKKYYLTIIKKY